MSQVARELEGESDLQATLDAAVRLAVVNVRGCEAAALSMADRHGEMETPASTDDRALGSDKLQYTLGEGPCLDAAWHERVVHSTDLSADGRWPTWGPRAVREYGVRSVLCLQLFTSANTLGALNLYSTRPGGFDENDRDDGMAIVAQIAVAVAAAQHAEQFVDALDSRTVIGQAVGIVMERYQLDSHAAFAVLARISSHDNVKLRDIARELVGTGRLHGTESG